MQLHDKMLRVKVAARRAYAIAVCGLCFPSGETLFVAWLCCQCLVSVHKLLPLPEQGRLLKAQSEQNKCDVA